MPQSFELRFTGNLAPNNQISARTLAHSLLHMQRVIDKLVIYEKRGALRKYSGLHNSEYAAADLILQQFEFGSIRVPFFNEAYGWLGERISGILDDPYERAARGMQAQLVSLDVQVPAAVNRAVRKDVKGNTQGDLIADVNARENEYYRAAVLQEINQLISPLRSSAIGDEDSITFSIDRDVRRREFRFDKQTSRNFGKIVTQKNLGPEAYYTGTLSGLNEVKVGKFPYKGTFKSDETKEEMTLLILEKEAAAALNVYNLSDNKFSFWGAPVTVYGQFDERRGDVVFLSFA